MAQWGLTDTFANTPKYLQPTETFDGTSAVSAANDTITITSHPFETGDAVVYTSSAPVAELSSGTTYYVVRVDSDTIKLATSESNATADPAVIIDFVTVNGAADDSVQKVADPAAVFVDTAEAATSTNRDKGLKTSGWNQYETYTTNGGTVTRHRVEPLVAVAVTATAAGDAADDAIAADPILIIDTQPLAASVTAPDPATFTVAASTTADGAVITYQWQVDDQLGGGFVDITGATEASYTVEDSTGLNGYQYQAVVTADINGNILTLTSNAVALTVA